MPASIPAAAEHKQLQTLLQSRIRANPHGLSEFARKASVSRPTLYKILSSVAPVKLRADTRDRICNALKLPSVFGKRVNMTDAWRLERVLAELTKHPGKATGDAVIDRVALAVYRVLKECGDEVKLTLHTNRLTQQYNYDIEISIGGPNLCIRLSLYFDQNKAMFELFSRSSNVEVRAVIGLLSPLVVGALAEYIRGRGRELDGNRRKYDVESLIEKIQEALMPA